ncbi:uncharacterized protein [Nicotiana tomentosiformis]|uniref:uncharacterized protein n=1 Tax=Nicotiana tomentosiformis TaxID=4098 RepID=UPI00388CECD7
MFARFSKIISNLKAFGKPYSSELIAFEKTHLKKTNKEEKKKIVAFKATTERADNDIDDDPKDLQEEIAMVSRKMDGLMRRYRNTRRCRIRPRRTRQYNEQDKNDGKHYDYGRFGHVQAECPDLKRKVSRGFNNNKSFGSWSDEDSSEHEEIANGAGQMRTLQMTNAKMTMRNVSWREVKQDILDLTLKESQKMMNELKRLNKEVKDWKLKLEEHHRRSHKGKWYLDSACSSHMTCDKNLFKEVTKIDGGSVKFDDDSKGKIVGTGTVPFNNNCGITKVYLVAGLNNNLLSISQLCDLGYEVMFKKTGCAIKDETCKIILPGKRYGNVYILDCFENIDGHICLTSIYDDPWLWHKKLGHASMHLIEKLSKHDLVIGLPKLNLSRNHVCDACQIEESAHVIFDENYTSAEKGIIAGDEDKIQNIQETRKSQESINKPDGVMESTNEIRNSQSESPNESTTHTSTIRPNEWRSEPEYPQRNKLNKDGKVVRNKAILVAQGYSQQEGVVYDKTLSPCLLNGFIEEEVYVKQPPGFEDSKFPYHVYKLTKALYGLKQAPRAWYERLSSFLIDHRFTRGKVDTTLFIKKSSEGNLIIQVYVDDINFGSANPFLCKEVSNLMQSEFEMCIMGELTFFLGLQIQQSEEGTFICQKTYTKELIQKFGMNNAKAIGTPMSPSTGLDKDEWGNPVDETKYRGMSGSLLYLTTSRPDCMFCVCKCVRFQPAPKESHLTAVKRIILYIIRTISNGLWYPRSNNFKLEGFSDADLAGDKEDRKSTSGICQLLGKAVIS